MNGKHFCLRSEKSTGEIYLCYQPSGKPLKRVSKFSNEIWLALAVDLIAENDGAKEVIKDIVLSDGYKLQHTIKLVGPNDDNTC